MCVSLECDGCPYTLVCMADFVVAAKARIPHFYCPSCLHTFVLVANDFRRCFGTVVSVSTPFVCPECKEEARQAMRKEQENDKAQR